MRWPPLIWPAISVASLLIIVGIGGEWNPEGFIPGLAIIVIGCGISLYLAYGPRGDRPPPRGIAWLVPLTAAFYLRRGRSGRARRRCLRAGRGNRGADPHHRRGADRGHRAQEGGRGR